MLALCCVGAGAGGFALYQVLDDATEPVREETRAYLTDLQAGDYASAYGRLCAADQALYTQTAFELGVRARGLDRLLNYRLQGVSVERVNNVRTGSVTAELTLRDGTTYSHIFELRNEDGSWKICGTPF